MKYHDRDLHHEPVNRTFASIVNDLRFTMGRHAVFVQLEPGDMTRYDFALIRLSHSDWHLVRYRGHEFVACAYLESYRHDSEVDHLIAQCLPVASGNVHTAQVLAWWIRKLFDHVNY